MSASISANFVWKWAFFLYLSNIFLPLTTVTRTKMSYRACVYFNVLFALQIRGGKKYFPNEYVVKWGYKKKQNICPLLKEVEVSGFCNVRCNVLDFVLYLIRGALSMEHMSITMRRWNDVEIEGFHEEKRKLEHVLSTEKMEINPNLRLSVKWVSHSCSSLFKCCMSLLFYQQDPIFCWW